jgi:hypothetical protein
MRDHGGGCLLRCILLLGYNAQHRSLGIGTEAICVCIVIFSIGLVSVL